MLDGKKTHIVVILFVLCTLAESALGFDIPGFTPQSNWLELVLGALGVSTLRDALRKFMP